MFDVLAPYTFINTRWQQYEHSSLPHYTVLMLLIITQRPLVFCRIRTACARAQFSGCTSKTNTHSETGQIAICSQTMTLGALSSRSALSMLVGALFKKFGLFLNNHLIYLFIYLFMLLRILGTTRIVALNSVFFCLKHCGRVRKICVF